MLLKEAVDNLAYRLGKSDNVPFKDRLKRDISVGRAEVLRREINKRNSISYMHSHSLNNLLLVEDKLGGLTNGPIKKIWRTVEKIPKPIMYHDQEPGFIYVGGIDSNSPHQFVRPERLTYRTTSFPEAQYYTYLDGYLYFFDNIKYINSRAVYSDIIKVGEVKNKDNNLCVPELTITDDLFTGIKRLLLEEENEIGLRYKPEVEVNVDQQ